MSNARRRGLIRLPRASTWIALVVGFAGLSYLAYGVGRLVVPEYLPWPNESGDEVSGLVRIVFGILLMLLAKALLEGDPTLRDTLLDANVLTAQAVIAAFDSDSTNTLVAVNAKDLRDATPNARFAILVRIEDEENVDKVRRLGVDQVISPSTLGGRLLAEQAVNLGAGSVAPAESQPET